MQGACQTPKYTLCSGERTGEQAAYIKRKGCAVQLMNIVSVTDMAKAVAFYEGFGLTRRESGEADEHWHQFLTGDAAFSLHLDDAPEPASRSVLNSG